MAPDRMLEDAVASIYGPTVPLTTPLEGQSNGTSVHVAGGGAPEPRQTGPASVSLLYAQNRAV
jgi:hypothetical protein